MTALFLSWIRQSGEMMTLSEHPERSATCFMRTRLTGRVRMLVRLARGTDYPPHRHAGVEELHLLHGELMIDDRKPQASDFIRAEAGSVDHRVWSETGCTCVLLTSTRDAVL